jgi:hypothetical protein
MRAFRGRRFFYQHVRDWLREWSDARAHVDERRRYRAEHCPRGHAYSPENTFWVDKFTRRGDRMLGPYLLRECRACRRAQALVRYYHGGHPRRVRALARRPWLPIPSVEQLWRVSERSKRP